MEVLSSFNIISLLIHVQLDVALEEIETQRNGLVFIYNMTNSKYSNFDYDLSQKMLTLLKGNYKLPLDMFVLLLLPPANLGN